MCVGIDRGRPVPGQGDDVSLTRGVRDNRKVSSNLWTDSLNWGGRGGKEKTEQGQGGRETQTSFVQSMIAGRTRQQMKLISWEWDHSCNTRNVIVDGKYLEEVDTFDTDGI